MSWFVASFSIVFVVLGLGWLAYERSRPSARMAAVVGTLAAVAALGRDAFVAIPDVKPITAITLVVGYALGPLPGFTVGAVGMLASNIMLGQGSYTPWQMAAWGLVGLAGAGLAALTKRHMGRFGLALACGITAMVAKEIMNLYTFTLAATHSPAALLATAGVALPFDITDAVASFLFGLAFGPELARLLGRMRARMDVTWQSAATPLAVLAICLMGASFAHADTSREVSYLEGTQNADGGFGGEKGQHSSELYSAWAAIGLAAAGRNPLALAHGGHTVLSSIEVEASTVQGAGDLERTILALRACGGSTRKLPGGNPVTRLLAYRSSDGSFGHLVNLTAFAVLALRAAGEPASSGTVGSAARWLAHQQNSDGGFGYAARGTASDIDDTGAALQGVVAASVPEGPVVAQAVRFLAGAQNADGGYPQERGGESNAQSTAWAVQGLLAAGQRPASFKHRGRSPLDYLNGLLAGDGSVRYSTTSAQTPVWVTAEALAALAEKPLPISPVPGSHAQAPPPANAAVASPPAGAASGAHTGASRVARVARRGLPGGQARLDALARDAGIALAIVLAPVVR
ncbi:MAG TPA: prenyltransferase/squalene oxidase repeat-containing protein [Solirubrobacteraceae bacterium]|jgi:energy-coupling factor transport system substrate-specific component